MTSKLRKALLESDVVIAPLAVGSHVDHVIVRHAAEQLGRSRLFYYPDVPYAQTNTAALTRQSARMKTLGYSVTPQQLSDWIAAALCYTTQIRMIEESAGPLPALLAEHANGDGLCLYSLSDRNRELEVSLQH